MWKDKPVIPYICRRLNPLFFKRLNILFRSSRSIICKAVTGLAEPFTAGFVPTMCYKASPAPFLLLVMDTMDTLMLLDASKTFEVAATTVLDCALLPAGCFIHPLGVCNQLTAHRCAVDAPTF